MTRGFFTYLWAIRHHRNEWGCEPVIGSSDTGSTAATGQYHVFLEMGRVSLRPVHRKESEGLTQEKQPIVEG